MSYSSRVKDIKRAQKEKLLYKELSQLLLPILVEDERLSNITLTRVSLSADKSIGTLYIYTPQGREHFDQILEKLKLYKPSLRKAIADRIKGRYTPELRFAFDDKYEKQERLEQLLSDLDTGESSS